MQNFQKFGLYSQKISPAALPTVNFGEHIENDDEFLKSCYFYLKKDGFLIINVPGIPELFSKYSLMAL